MKKVMLFITAMLFAVSVNAATLSLTASGSTPGVTQDTSSLTDQIVSGFGQTDGDASWASLFDLTTTADTAAKIEWSFNPEAAVTTALLEIWDISNIYSPIAVASFNVVGDFVTTFNFLTGKTYGIDFTSVASTASRYDLTVSAVPVPAALFLFAPALLGFLGLRRKATLAA